MVVALFILAGLALFVLAVDKLGAESRPDFVDPNKKHGPFVSPFRLGKR